MIDLHNRRISARSVPKKGKHGTKKMLPPPPKMKHHAKKSSPVPKLGKKGPQPASSGTPCDPVNGGDYDNWSCGGGQVCCYASTTATTTTCERGQRGNYPTMNGNILCQY